MFSWIRALIRDAVVGGFQDGLRDVGVIDQDATGSAADQVRAALRDKPLAPPAVESADEKDEAPAARGRKGRGS